MASYQLYRATCRKSRYIGMDKLRRSPMVAILEMTSQMHCLVWNLFHRDWISLKYFPRVQSTMSLFFNSSPPSATYMRPWTWSEMVRLWLVAYSAPSHYLNQCWVIVNWTSITNFSEILIKIQNFSFTEMHLKILSAKWRPFCAWGDN